MKILAAIVTCLLAFALPAVAAEKGEKKGKTKLRHVVCFKFKESATPDQIREVEGSFKALKKKIPEIASFEWGTNISPEKLDKGFTHCFLLTFRSPKDRDAYLVHPDHKEFGKNLGAVLGDVFVIDYQARN